MLSLWLSLQQYSTWFFSKGARERGRTVFETMLSLNILECCVCTCVRVVCVFCCFVDSDTAGGLLFFLRLSSLLPSDQWFPSLCVYGIYSFLIRKKSTSMTSKYMWVCLSGTHSGGVVSWSQPILCVRSQDKGIYFGPNVIYRYKKLVRSVMISELSGVRKWARLVAVSGWTCLVSFCCGRVTTVEGFAFSALKFHSFPGELQGEWGNCLTLSKQGLLCNPDSRPSILVRQGHVLKETAGLARASPPCAKEPGELRNHKSTM